MTRTQEMTLHNVSPFGLLQVQNDTNTCVRVILHLKVCSCHFAPEEAQRAKRCAESSVPC